MAGGEDRGMNIKWIGAILIIAGCGKFGFSLAASHRAEEKALRELIAALDYMQCELQYRLTPLPELCRQAAQQQPNAVGHVLLMLAQELECSLRADVQSCLVSALQSGGPLPDRVKNGFEALGTSLGRFDMEGQIQGLESVRSFCRQELESLSENRENRLRSYQTLGLCAGAALAILFV